MNKPNPEIDKYIHDGCGRCNLFQTPECKVNFWTDELKRLREVLLQTDLREELKWSAPCYTHNNKNILMLSALKDVCVISFFKGVLLKDSQKLLEKPGENSQSARYIKFKSVDRIDELETDIKKYVAEAIELEKAGKEVEFKKNPEPIPEELQVRLDGDLTFKKAFEALTPGRQRGYILHFSAPKQSKTRTSRIEKCIPKILEGKGFHDR